MTHEELLQKINEMQYDDYKGIGAIPDWPYQVIRAVVELHKPCRIDKDMTYCEGCSNSAFFPWEYCPTIEAIEKVLS